MKKTIFIAAFICSFLGNSQNLLLENFGSYNTGVQLSGQGTWTNNSSAIGGTGTCTGIGCTNAFVNASALNYTNYGTSTKSVQLLSDKDGCGKGFAAVTSGDIFVAFVINLSAASVSATPNDFLRVASGGNFNTTFRVTAKNFGTGFQIGLLKNAGTTTYSSSTYSFNQDHLVVIKYSIVAGADNDAISLFVDPVYNNTEPSFMTAQFFTTVGTDLSTSIDRFIIRQNAAGLPSGKIGLVSVSSTWAGLSFLTAGLNELEKGTFEVLANQTSKGILSIKSIINTENSVLNIYTLSGALLQTKNISLEANINEIAIQNLPTATPFVLEIVSENKRFSQKIISQ